MKKLLCILLVLIGIGSFAFADDVDLTAMG